MNEELMSGASEQLRMPLCSRYFLARFETFRVRINEDGDLSGRTLRWAFGVLSNGESEVLGVWPEPSRCRLPWEAVFGDLFDRGVESIQFVLSDEPIASQISLSTAYPSAVTVPSSRSEHTQSLHRRLRATDAAMRHLQDQAERAIHRHGPFRDAAEATKFVTAALSRAERRREHAGLEVNLIARKAARASRTASL